MNDKAKEARRAYKRAWNHQNKDKVKAAQERYWNKKAEQLQQVTPQTDEPATEEA